MTSARIALRTRLFWSRNSRISVADLRTSHVPVRATRQDPRRGSVLLGTAQPRPQRGDVAPPAHHRSSQVARLGHDATLPAPRRSRRPVRAKLDDDAPAGLAGRARRRCDFSGGGSSPCAAAAARPRPAARAACAASASTRAGTPRLLRLHVHPQPELARGLGGLRADAGDDRAGVRLAGDADQVAHRRGRGEAHRVEPAGLDRLADLGAGGGAARTVRYAVTSSISQPRSRSPAASVSVAMSARGSSTRSTGSSTSSYGGKSASRPSEDCSARATAPAPA